MQEGNAQISFISLFCNVFPGSILSNHLCSIHHKFQYRQKMISLHLNYIRLSRWILKLGLLLSYLAGTIFSFEGFYKVISGIHCTFLRNCSVICQLENTRSLFKPKPVYGELRNYKFMPNLIFEFWIIKLPLLILICFVISLLFSLVADCRPLIVGEWFVKMIFIIYYL